MERFIKIDVIAQKSSLGLGTHEGGGKSGDNHEPHIDWSCRRIVRESSD